MEKATLQQWAKESSFHAKSIQTNEIIYCGNDITDLVAEIWLIESDRKSEWALAQINNPKQKPIFKIEKRIINNQSQICLCLSAGVFDFAIASFHGATVNDVLSAFEKRHKTIELQGRAWWLNKSQNSDAA